MLTGRDRTWWKNLKGEADVSLLLQRKLVSAFAEPELDPDAVKARMVEYLKHVPQAARPIGVRVENGKAHEDDIANTPKDRPFIRIEPRLP